MKHFMSSRFENLQMLKNQQLCFHLIFLSPVLLHTLHTKIIEASSRISAGQIYRE